MGSTLDFGSRGGLRGFSSEPMCALVYTPCMHKYAYFCILMHAFKYAFIVLHAGVTTSARLGDVAPANAHGMTIPGL